MAGEGRHPATEQLRRWFEFGHLPEGLPKGVSQLMQAMANSILTTLNDGPELTAGLRKLLEAKDCFVRQAIADEEERKRNATN